MDNTNRNLFAVSFVLGFFICALLGDFTTAKEMNEKRQECEASLPRDQVCEMKFSPKVK